MINIVTSSRYRIHRKSLNQYAETLFKKYDISEKAVLNIAFIGKRKMRDIAKTYKHEDVALPVLAFPYKGEKIDTDELFGEVVMCYPQVVLLAAEREKKVDDTIEQLLDHGVKNLLK